MTDINIESRHFDGESATYIKGSGFGDEPGKVRMHCQVGFVDQSFAPISDPLYTAETTIDEWTITKWEDGEINCELSDAGKVQLQEFHDGLNSRPAEYHIDGAGRAMRTITNRFEVRRADGSFTIL